jgi:hypothetical protein
MTMMRNSMLFRPTKDSLAAAHEAALLNSLDTDGWYYTVREYGQLWAIWWQAEDGGEGWW